MTRSTIKAKRGRPRRGPMRSGTYRRWLNSRRCVVCRDTETFAPPWLRTIQAAHTENNGMGSKGPDSSCAPLCGGHHAQYDAGRDAFEVRYGVDMKQEAAEHFALWQSEQEAA